MAKPQFKRGGLGGALSRAETETNTQTVQYEQQTEAFEQSKEILLKGVLKDASEEERALYLDMFATARVEVYGLYSRAVETYLKIGKLLCELKGRTQNSPQIYNRFVSDYDDNGRYRPGAMPFGRAVAVRMERVYEDVMSGKFERAFLTAGRVFSQDLLPPYSVAYFLTQLSEDQMVEAVKLDLVRPDITQHQVRFAVADIKREHPEPKDPPKRIRKSPEQQRLDTIHKEKGRALAAIQEMQALIERLEAEETEILIKMGGREVGSRLSINKSQSPKPEAAEGAVQDAA